MLKNNRIIADFVNGGFRCPADLHGTHFFAYFYGERLFADAISYEVGTGDKVCEQI